MAAASDQSVPLFSDGDIASNVYVAPPLTSLSEANLREKLPLVCKIIEAYEGIPLLADAKSSICNREDYDHKEATSWVLGLLFTMSIKSLESLAGEPQVAEIVCDSAKNFALLFSISSPLKLHFRKPDVVWMPMLRPGAKALIARRDNDSCVVSDWAVAVQGTHLTTFDVHPDSFAIFLLRDGVRYIIDTLFDAHSAGPVWNLLCDESAREAWNIVTLNKCLSRLFELGYVALRPLALTTTTEGQTKHLVRFSIHWLPKTMPVPDARAGVLDVHTVRAMVTETAEYAQVKPGLGEIHAVTHKDIMEGQEFSVAHDTYRHAENMYLMLALRWSVDMARCLAGGIGIDNPWNRSGYGSE